MPEPSLGSGFEGNLDPATRRAIFDLRRVISDQEARIATLESTGHVDADLKGTALDPTAHKLMVETGTFTGTTDGFGTLAMTFQTTFAAPPICLGATDSAVTATNYCHPYGEPTTTAVTWTTGASSVSVKIHYIVIGVVAV